MADRPALFYLDRLRKLAGEPHISSPEANAAVLRSERVFTKPRGWTRPSYGAAEPNAALAAAGCILTHIEELGGDNQNVELYLVYETIPGTVLASPQLDERGDTQTVETQVVARGTPAATATLLVEGSVEAVDNVRSRKTTRTVASHSTLGSKEFNARGELVTTADDIVAPGTVPADGLLVDSDAVVAQTKQKSRRVRKTVAARVTLTSKENRKVGRQETPVPQKYLSGETLSTAEDIVDPGTAPDTLSQTVISSTVEQTTATKATRRTITRPDQAFPTLTEKEVSRQLGAGGNVATRTFSVSFAAGATVTPAGGFGILSDQTNALSKEYTERVTLSVSSFPVLPGYTAGAKADDYPGKYGSSGGQGETTYRDQTVVPGSTPALAAGEEILSRRALDKFHEELRIGTRTTGGGAGNLSGTELGRFGTITHSWTLGSTAADTGQNVISSAASPAGGAKMEVETRRSADSATPTTRENDGPRIPEKFLGGIVTQAVETPVAATASPDVAGGTLKSVVRPTENPARAIKTTTTLAAGSAFSALKDVELSAQALGAMVTITQTILDVPDGQDPPAPSTDFLTVSADVRALGGGKALQTVARLTAGAYPVLTDHDANDPDADGGPTTTTRTLVAAAGATADALGGNVLDSRVEQINARLSRIVTKRRDAGAFPELVGTFIDEQTGGLVTVKKQLLDTAAAASATTNLIRPAGGRISPSPAGGAAVGGGVSQKVASLDAFPTQIGFGPGFSVVSSYDAAGSWTDLTLEEVRPVNQWKSLRIRTIYAQPPPWEEERKLTYRFPTLLYGFYSDDNLGAIYQLREGFSPVVTARVEVTYTRAKEKKPVFYLEPVGWSYPRCAIHDVLTDPGLQYSGTINGVSFALPIPASKPTRSEYLGKIGQEVMIDHTSRRVRPGIWRNEAVFITLR